MNVVLESESTDRQTNKQTDDSDTLITILCTPTEVEVITVN